MSEGRPDPTVVLVEGKVRPAPDRPLHPEQVRGLLRADGVLAVVGVHPPGHPDAVAGSLPVAVVIAADAAGRAHVLRDGAVAPGPEVADVAARLAAATGGTVDLDPVDPRGHEGKVADAAAALTAPVDGASVLVSRTPVEYLAEVARRMRAGVRAVQDGGWTVVALGAGAVPWRYGWTAREFPVAHLHRHDGERRITLVPRRRGRGLSLSPGFRPVTTHAPEEVDAAGRAVLDALLEPDRWEAADLTEVLGASPLAYVDVRWLRDALASPDDDGWYRRVLHALGMPTSAADVAEGRADLPGAVVLEPAGLGASLLRMWDLYVDDGMRRRGEVRGMKRWYAATVRHPALLLLTGVPEVVLGAAGAVWAVQHWGGAYPVVVLAVCALWWLGAVHSVVTVVRGRRRWRGVPGGV